MSSMRSPTGSSHNNDEWTPLLQEQRDNVPHTTTPLPTAQIFILLLPWSAEATVFYSISPYINEVRRMVVFPLTTSVLISI